MVRHDSLKKMMTHLGILRSKSRVSNHVQMSNMSIHIFICTNKCVYIISIYIYIIHILIPLLFAVHEYDPYEP